MGWGLLVFFVTGPAALAGPQPEPVQISVEGRLECRLPGGKGAGVLDCVKSGGQWVLKAEDGVIWQFLDEDPRTGILLEERLHSERLHVVGRVRSGHLEIVDLHIIREHGHVLPHYRCDVCSITAYAPGPCWCCQAPFEYREKPARDSKTAGGHP